MKNLPRHANHVSYWIDDGQLYESYEQFPDIRHRHLMEVKGMPDTERCTFNQIKIIKQTYVNGMSKM